MDKHGIPRTKDLIIGKVWGKKWSINDAIREVLQNTIDGAKEYGKCQLQPLNKTNKKDPWQVEECNEEESLKWKGYIKYIDEEEIQAYESTLVLVSKDGESIDDKNKLKCCNNQKKWRKCKEVMAFIQITYLVKKSKWDPTKIEYGQIEGSILVKLVAENRAKLDRSIVRSFFTIGKSSKGGNNNVAGMHGEGLKIGANKLTVSGYKASIEINGLHREYLHRDTGRKEDIVSEESTLHAICRKPRPKMSEDVVIFTVEKDQYRSFRGWRKHTFDHSTFQLMNPGIESPSKGEIMLDKDRRGHIFCQGIRVFDLQEKNAAFGYAVPKCNIGRDRNVIPMRELCLLVRKLWEGRPEDDGKSMQALYRHLQNDPNPNKLVELEMLSESKTLVKELVEVFQTIEGDNAFPCYSTEKEEATQLLVHMKVSVMPTAVVDLLRNKGGYRNIVEELKIFYDKSNSSKKNIKGDSCLQEIIELALLRLNSIVDEGDMPFVLDSEAAEKQGNSRRVFFVNGSHLSNIEKHMCKYNKSIYYVHDGLLNSEKDIESTAWLLGYHISLQVKNSLGENSFHFRYAETKALDKSSIQSSLSVKELDTGGFLVQVCVDVSEALLQKDVKIRITDVATNVSLTLLPVSNLSTLAPAVLDKMKRNTKYTFEAIESKTGEIIKDDVTGDLCRCELKMKDYTIEEKCAAAIRIQSAIRVMLSKQRKNKRLKIRKRWRDIETMIRGFRKLQMRYRLNCMMDEDDNSVGDDNNGSGFQLNNDYMPADNNDDENDTEQANLPQEDYSEEENEDDELNEEELNALLGSADFFQPCGSVADSNENFTLDSDEDSSDDDELESSPKRHKTCPPTEMDQVEIQGRVFRRGQWYSKGSIYCKIIRFDGKKKATDVWVEICKPFEATFAGSLDEPSRNEYVQTPERLESIKWLATFNKTEIIGSNIPSPKWLYTERPRKSTIKEHDLTCHYELLQRSHCLDAPEEPTFCESFAGVGGVSCGLEEAGMTASVLIERDSLAAASLRHCHPNATIFAEDINVVLDRIRKNDPAYVICKGDDHVWASPPCQGFSSANRNAVPTENDLRNQALSDTFVDLVDLVKPYTANMENVTGMMRRKNKHRLQKIIRRLVLSGYDVCLAIHNALYYGDPQSRQRVILYVSRLGVPIELPKRTHTNDKIKTVGDVIGDLLDIDPQPGGGIVTTNGKTIHNHCLYANLTDENMRHFTELDWDKPAPTFTTCRRFIHPKRNRTLTLREYARIMGFPDTKVFDGSPKSILRQIGNAVPVGLSKAIGESVMNLYKLNREKVDDS